MQLRKAETAPETVTLGSVRSRARTGIQPEIDQEAATLVKAWEAAGKPSYETLTALDGEGKPSQEFMAAQQVWYVVDAGDATEVKKAIRRACLLHKGLPVYAGNVKNDDGTVTVGFTYAPPAVKAETPSEPASDNAPEGSTETQTGTPDAGTADQENPSDDAPQRRGFGRRG